MSLRQVRDHCVAAARGSCCRGPRPRPGPRWQLDVSWLGRTLADCPPVQIVSRLGGQELTRLCLLGCGGHHRSSPDVIVRKFKPIIHLLKLICRNTYEFHENFYLWWFASEEHWGLFWKSWHRNRDWRLVIADIPEPWSHSQNVFDEDEDRGTDDHSAQDNWGYYSRLQAHVYIFNN